MLGYLFPELSDIQHHSYILLSRIGQQFSLQYCLTSVPRWKGACKSWTSLPAFKWFFTQEHYAASWHYLCISPIQLNRYIFIPSSNRYFVEELVSAKCGLILINSGSLPFFSPTQNQQRTNHTDFSAAHHLTESKYATEIHLHGPLLQHKQNSASQTDVTFQDPPDIDSNPF